MQVKRKVWNYVGIPLLGAILSSSSFSYIVEKNRNQDCTMEVEDPFFCRRGYSSTLNLVHHPSLYNVSSLHAMCSDECNGKEILSLFYGDILPRDEAFTRSHGQRSVNLVKKRGGLGLHSLSSRQHALLSKV